MATLQASLLLKPPLSLPYIRFPRFHSYSHSSSSCSFLPSRKFSISCCTLQSSNFNFDEIPNSPNSNLESQVSDFGGIIEGNSTQKVENSASISGSSSCSGGEEGGLSVEERENGGENEGFVVEKKVEEGKLAIMVFLVGIWATFKKNLEKIWLSGWLSWWPWQQEKRLQRLIAEADANPSDAALQSSLLAELNKHSPESVIKRFEQRDLAVDSRGTIEYLRALVATNAIAEYLPDEQSGKPSSIPTLLQELKERASGNAEELSYSPGISEKKPLHVVMVDPKVSNKSTRIALDLISTVLFTVAIGLVWIMGAAELQIYSLGGIVTPGVGSSSSYTTKESNKEVLPEKAVFDNF